MQRKLAILNTLGSRASQLLDDDFENNDTFDAEIACDTQLRRKHNVFLADEDIYND